MTAQDPRRALDGVKVIDLTRVLGGPYCTMILADQGAEVIKVEPPQGDEVRLWGPPFLERADGSQDASYFLGVNRNKRSIALDLSRPEGAEVLFALLEGADVLVENFRPGTMEKWRLGYKEVLKARFPGLIHCRVSGFGGDGPLGGLPGYDAVVQAMSGLMSINGEADGPPVRMGTPLVDMGTGLYAAVGILSALQERTRSGLGQYLDISLYDCGLALLHPSAANWFLNGKRPQRMGSRHPNISPYETYPTRTCEMFLGIGNNGQFRKLCDALGLDGLADDPCFVTNALRVENRPALMEILGAALVELDGHEVCERLLRLGLPAGPILAVDEALSAPHTRHRQMVVDVEGVRTLGTPVKMSRTPGGPRTAPPAFAADTFEVLTALGFPQERIAELVAKGVVQPPKAGGG